MKDTPNRYNNICQKALDAKSKYKLNNVQTELYNHVCRKDFYLSNEDGQKFYDDDNNGFGWSGDREWVKRKFNVLVKNKLVKFEKAIAPRDARYRIWHWYDPEVDFEDLIDAGCFVSTHKLFVIKKYLNLPDGFDKNATYGDMQFIKTMHEYIGCPPMLQYSFKYKKYTCNFKRDAFDDMIHQVFDAIQSQDKVDLYAIETDSIDIKQWIDEEE